MTTVSELSRPVIISDLKDTPCAYAITATAAECGDLAQRFGVHSISGVTANLKLWCDTTGIIHLCGTAQVELTQQSIVTLEIMASRIAVIISDRFARGQKAIDRVYRQNIDEDGEKTMDLDGEDPPELLAGETLDIGEQVAQALSLEIDPYPREAAYGSILDALKDGLVAPGPAVAIGSRDSVPDSAEIAEVEEKPNPFAVLASLNKTKPS